MSLRLGFLPMAAAVQLVKVMNTPRKPFVWSLLSNKWARVNGKR